MKSRLFRVAAACVAVFFATAGAGVDAVTLPPKIVPAAVTEGRAAFIAPSDSRRRLQLAFHLQPRNQAELSQLLLDLYDPRSPLFHKYLSVKEFTERFGPSQSDYDAVVSWAKSNGFELRGTTPNRRLVAVEGSVETVNRVLHVTMSNYQHPVEPRTFYAPDREPTTSGLGVSLLQITGLNDYQLPGVGSHQRLQPAADGVGSGSNAGSGPFGAFVPSDMRAAYYGSGPLTGRGQVIGILSFDGYLQSDVQLFYSQTGMSSSVPIVNRLISGFNGACTKVTSPTSQVCEDGEQILDIVNAIGMAPGIDQLLFYEGPANQNAEILNLMATDDTASVLSSSWWWSPADQASVDPIFQEFAAQGQSFVTASGDCGAYGGNCTGSTSPPASYQFPLGDPYITSVGGTNLTTSGPGGRWVAEAAWPPSGGGYVPGTSTPTWQKLVGVINSSNNGSMTVRNAPDVAAEAGYDNCTVNNGVFSTNWGGTSFAAPRWAGFLALMNEQSVARGLGSVGFINPAIYRLGTSHNYQNAFHDIVSGSNPSVGFAGFNAVAGYDLVTGWGSPKGVNLIEQMTGGNPYGWLPPVLQLILQH